MGSFRRESEERRHSLFTGLFGVDVFRDAVRLPAELLVPCVVLLSWVCTRGYHILDTDRQRAHLRGSTRL